MRMKAALDLRTRMIKCYVLPVLLYGVEAWTFNVYCQQKLETFEMMRIPWTEHVTNVENNLLLSRLIIKFYIIDFLKRIFR